MTTIGDVFAVIAALLGIGVSSWALMVSCALLFPNRVSRARVSNEHSARTNIAVGIVMLLPAIAGIAMIGSHHPVLMFVGWALMLGILATGAIGAAGLGYLASDTIRRMDSAIGEYPAFLRGSGFLVTAAMLPILGWFLFAPLILLASFGGGFRAITGRIASAAPISVEHAA